MYRRPKFLEILLEIRREMALEADYDVELFAEIARSGIRPTTVKPRVSTKTEVHQAGESQEISTITNARKPVVK